MKQSRYFVQVDGPTINLDLAKKMVESFRRAHPEHRFDLVQVTTDMGLNDAGFAIQLSPTEMTILEWSTTAAQAST